MNALAYWIADNWRTVLVAAVLLAMGSALGWSLHHVNDLTAQLEAARNEAADARAREALCSAGVAELQRKSAEQSKRVRAAEKRAADAIAQASKVQPMPPAVADKGCEAAAAWAADQVAPLIDKWNSGQ